jgi:hypothetical protein
LRGVTIRSSAGILPQISLPNPRKLIAKPNRYAVLRKYAPQARTGC